MQKINWKDCEIPLFEGIDKNNIEPLLHCLFYHIREYDKGSYILLDQENVEYVGIVLKGSVHMIKEDIWGNRTLISYISKGETFGETFALRKEQKSNVSFVAAQNSQIMFVALHNLLHPCKQQCGMHNHLSQNMYDIIGLKNIQLMERIEVASKGSLREKLLTYLSLQAQKQGSKYFTVPLSRTEMSQYLQSNRSAMTRELSAMRDEGLIDFDGNTFQIKK